MTNKIDWVAIPANPALAHAIEDFLAAANHDRKASDAYVHLMDYMTDRILGLFLVEPARMMALTPGQQKVIDFAVSTAGKASHMLTRQIFGKLKGDQLAPVAAYIRKVHWQENGHTFVGFPVSKTFAADFRQSVDVCLSGNGTSELQQVSDVMDQLTDDIMEALFIANTRNVKLGFVTQKALSVGSEGSRKALHAVNHKVLKSMDDDALKTFMQHYQSIIIQRNE